jgi:hypothetical protein
MLGRRRSSYSDKINRFAGVDFLPMAKTHAVLSVNRSREFLPAFQFTLQFSVSCDDDEVVTT